VSLIERGHLEGVSQRTLRRIAAALEVRIDILAFHPLTGSLLVIELKTEIVSIEDLLMTMDVRVRERHPQSRLTG
jgi:hypothetical protein